MKRKIVNLVLALALILAVGAAYAVPPGWANPGTGPHAGDHGNGNGYGHYKDCGVSPC